MRLSYRQLPTWIYCDKVTRCLLTLVGQSHVAPRHAEARRGHIDHGVSSGRRTGVPGIPRLRIMHSED